MPVLVEYQPTRVRLDATDLEFVLDLVAVSGGDDSPRLFESVTPTRDPGVYLVRSGPFVGRLGLPSGRYLDLRSRFSFPDVIELIRLSARSPVRVDTLTVPADSGHSLVDVVAAAFAREVERIAGMGLAKGYELRRYDQPPYPGTIDVARHLGRFAARPDRLCTRARRITRDVEENRVLLAALEALRRAPLAAGASMRLDRLAPVFADVSWAPVSPDRIPSLRLTALTGRYREALGLAEIVLRSASLVPQGSRRLGVGVVYSMPRVWERYVERCVRQAWPPDVDVEGSHGFDLTTSLRAEADVIVRRGDEILALYDAKYKWLDHAPARGDLYQMITYCERLGLSEATLVYPGNSAKRAVRVGDRSIHVVGLEGPVSGRGDAFLVGSRGLALVGPQLAARPGHA